MVRLNPAHSLVSILIVSVLSLLLKPAISNFYSLNLYFVLFCLFFKSIQEQQVELDEILAKRSKNKQRTEEKPAEEKTTLHSECTIHVHVTRKYTSTNNGDFTP